MRYTLGIFSLLALLIAAPLRADDMWPNAWLDPYKDRCTYLGNGMGSSGTDIKEAGTYAQVYWVDLNLECKRDYANSGINPEGYVETQGTKAISAFLTAQAKSMVYKNMKGSAHCEVIASSGAAANLTSEPGNPKYWEHPSEFVLVSYRATFLCRTPSK